MGDQSLDSFLARYAADGAPLAGDIAATVAAIAATAIDLAATISEGLLGATFAEKQGGANSDGDLQRGLDLLADDRFLTALQDSAVGVYASEEMHEPVVVGADRSLALAIDPLDGSSNIDANVSVGTIFSIRQALHDYQVDPNASFYQAGRAQLAAGVIVYGPQLALVLTLGKGTQIFVHSRGEGGFRLAQADCVIPSRTREFAINAANYRHWDEAVRLYFDDCIKGGHGPRESEFNMRWIASLVADAYRILIRGGVFLLSWRSPAWICQGAAPAGL
ncbi:fructose-bisphosphatase class I [Glacieibacterium sp.]|uniref:fructose-bisphosphatase class I n=1 Tax=Glacieibacterium sp. TaxID=2860237 RepID=UPI003B00665E